MKHVLVRAKQYSAHASSAEQGALRYLLEHPAEIPRLSIKQFSSLSYSSPSTIVRLCRKLGFDGYREVQQSVLYELALREKSNRPSADLITDDTISEIMEHTTYRNISSLEDSLKLLEPDALENAADLLYHARSILLFGLGASQLVAKDAYLKFIRVDKPCCCCEDIHSQYVLAKNARKDDVAIIISYSGYTEEILRCAQYLKAQGTPIIAITRFEASPIAQLATQCLYVVASEDLFRPGAMSSRISQLNMIDILYTAFFNHDPQKNIRLYSRNRIAKENP